MTTADDTALIEQIARAAFDSDRAESGLTPLAWESQIPSIRREYRTLAAAVLPIIRKAQADAWSEGYNDGVADTLSPYTEYILPEESR